MTPSGIFTLTPIIDPNYSQLFLTPIIELLPKAVLWKHIRRLKKVL